jgi:hypothetical protein
MNLWMVLSGALALLYLCKVRVFCNASFILYCPSSPASPSQSTEWNL